MTQPRHGKTSDKASGAASGRLSGPRSSDPLVVSTGPGERLARRTLAGTVADGLRRRLLTEWTPGGKLPGERALVRELGVGASTVREALARLAQEGLVERRHGSGTYAADPSSRRYVGIHTDHLLSAPGGSRVALRIMDELARWFHAQGFKTRLYHGTTPAWEAPAEPVNPAFLDDIRQGILCGVVSISYPPVRRWLTLLEERPIPLVGYGGTYSVAIDRPDMARQGLRHLAAHGRTRIAVLSAPMTGTWSEALRQAMVTNGIPIVPEWWRCGLHPSRTAAGWEEFRDIWSARAEKPDGLLVLDDVLFGDAALAMRELRIAVPKALYVVAHRNRGMERSYPFPVTWLEYDPREQAAAMGDMLLRLIRREPVPCPHVAIPMRLIPWENSPAPVRASEEQQAVKGRTP